MNQEPQHKLTDEYILKLTTLEVAVQEIKSRVTELDQAQSKSNNDSPAKPFPYDVDERQAATLVDLQQELNELKERCQESVHATTDLNWEKSKLRLILVVALIYLISLFSFRYLGFFNPFTSALIPALGYFLSRILLNVIQRKFIGKLDVNE